MVNLFNVACNIVHEGKHQHQRFHKTKSVPEKEEQGPSSKKIINIDEGTNLPIRERGTR